MLTCDLSSKAWSVLTASAGSMGSLPLFVAVREGKSGGQQERDQLVLVNLTALNRLHCHHRLLRRPASALALLISRCYSGALEGPDHEWFHAPHSRCFTLDSLKVDLLATACTARGAYTFSIQNDSCHTRVWRCSSKKLETMSASLMGLATARLPAITSASYVSRGYSDSHE
jgi:hypothetical protein